MPADSFVNLNGIRLHLVDWSGTGQPILLVHGLASNAKIWNFVAPELAKSFRVAAIDQRSHGVSSEPQDGKYGFEAVCSDLHEACTSLGFERPVIVGHSWGGGVALEYAARYPEAVAGVVTIDGGFVGMARHMSWEETKTRLAPPRLAGTPLAEFRQHAKKFMGALYSDEVLEIILGNFETRADGTIASHLAFENHMKIVRAMWEQDPDKLYPHVKCPALFLPCIPPEPRDEASLQFLNRKREVAVVARQLMPQVKIEWLEDSIHDVPIQRPGLLAEKIRSFVTAL